MKWLVMMAVVVIAALLVARVARAGELPQVGKPAPEFTATGADGKPYTVKPGDGRTKVVVFYMGFR